MYLIMQKSVAFLAKVSPFQATPCTWPLATNKPRKELSQAVNFPSTSHCNELGLRAVSKQVLLVVLLLSFRVNHPGFLLFGYPRASLLFFFLVGWLFTQLLMPLILVTNPSSSGLSILADIQMCSGSSRRGSVVNEPD